MGARYAQDQSALSTSNEWQRECRIGKKKKKSYSATILLNSVPDEILTAVC